MPSKSPAQHRLMEAAAHTKGGFGGVPQKVGKEFVKADKMADGGVASLGGMVSSTPNTPTVASRDNSRAPQNMLDGAQQTADNSIEGGDGEKVYGYKKGGHITTRRMSTCSPSKKSSNW